MALRSRAADQLCDSAFCQMLASFNVPLHNPDQLSEAWWDHCVYETEAKGFGQQRDWMRGNGDWDPDDEDWEPEEEEPYEETEPFPLALGSWRQISSRKNCPFCRIATAAVLTRSKRGKQIQASDKIEVEYLENRRWFNLKIGHSELFEYGEFITFYNPASKNPDYFSRTINPSRIDFNLVKGWLSECDAKHSATCHSSSPYGISEPPDFRYLRLIDVQKSCVVKLPLQTKYVALSYVWGKVKIPRLFKQNIVELERPGSLHKTFKTIPRTINDAIEFVRLIGEKYLWTDCLCLVQDDPEEMQSGIRSMGSIYGNAHVTVIAANGDDAEAGLPRIRPNPTEIAEQLMETIKPGLQLMVMRSADVYLKDATWATRGWTFQEQMLSRRSIIFAGNRAFFRCRKVTWPEECITEPELSSELIRLRDNFVKELDELYFCRYMFEALKLYQGRELTFPNDAIDAVTGIFQQTSGNSEITLVQGLPVLGFDKFLLFRIDHKAEKKHRRANRQHGRRNIFPSWSWAGWHSEIDWPARIPDPQGPESTTWIQWYTFHDGNLHKLPAKEGLPWSGGTQRSLPGAGNIRPRNYRIDDLATMPPERRFSHLAAAPGNKTLRLTPNAFPLLVFCTAFVSLQAGLRGVWEEGIVSLYDKDQVSCGYIDFDVAAKHNKGPWLAELIVLSDYETYREPNGPNSGSYNGLHVEWTGSFYERRGLARINKRVLSPGSHPAPQWKIIVLG